MSGPARARHLLGAALLFVVSPAAFVAVLLWTRSRATHPGEPELFWDEAARREVQAIVERRYVDPLDDEDARRLFHEAMSGYVSGLDPFSRWFPPSERRALEQETSGAFGGVGVLVQSVPEGLRVTGVRRGGPAESAGIEPGDLVLAADGVSLTGRTLDAMLAAVKGAPDTEVVLSVRSGTADPRDVRVVRAVVPFDSVPGVRLLAGTPAVGYVRIEQFTDRTGADARAAVTGLLREGAAALVLDLRRNLGGVVRAAVETAGLFLPEDTVVCVTRRREGPETHAVPRSDGAAPAAAVPLVVLVDETTASASEILAGALQDHGRALLVGERTFGKFLVQSLVEAPSSGGVVRLTTSRYETPRGRSHARDEFQPVRGGLLPDVRVPLRGDAERDSVGAALGALAGPEWRTLPRDGPEPRDPQLEAALELLRGALPPSEPVPRRPQ